MRAEQSSKATGPEVKSSAWYVIPHSPFDLDPRWRTSKSHGVDPVPLFQCTLPLPRAASSAIVSSLTPSPLYSLPDEHQSCSLPSTTQRASLQQISIHAAITPPTPCKHSSSAVIPCTYPTKPLHTCCPPANHFQHFTCRLPRPVLLLAATLLGTKASAILSVVE